MATFIMFPLLGVAQGIANAQTLSAHTQAYSSVLFVENDSSADVVTSTQTENQATSLNLIANLNPHFANGEEAFFDWNTQPDGSGESFADGSVYTFGQPLTLYAIWCTAYSSALLIENDNGSDQTYVQQISNHPTNLYSFATLTPKFANQGQQFVGWNTQPDGSGAAFADGAIYSFNAPIYLYAIWKSTQTATANFVANGGTGSTAPITSTENSLVNTPTSAGIAKQGYTFVGWNTQADGSGTEYAAGAPYTLSTNQTLYAQWTPDIYTVSFNSDGGSPSLTSLSYSYASPGILLPSLTLANESFTGWWTAASGGSLVGVGGAQYVPSASVSLYAQWSLSQVIVTFSAGSGTTAQQSLTYSPGGSGIILPSATLTGSAFAGWYSAPTGGVLVGTAGTVYSPTSGTTLYAQFNVIPTDTVSFDPNGGSGSVASIVGVQGTTVTLPFASGLSLPGYKLTSWNTSSNGTGTSIAVGGALQVTAPIVLFAQWVSPDPKVLVGSVGSFAKNSSALTPKLKAQITKLVALIKSKKFTKISLYGYTTPSGLVSLNMSLSSSRARVVASYLQGQLGKLKAARVSFSSAGEGAIPGQTSPAYSRVEVFAQ